MNVNFVFTRHGYGCHNAMSNLASANIVSKYDAYKFMRNENVHLFKGDLLPLNDPVLTNIGVDASIHNGCVVRKILNKLPYITKDPTLNTDVFNVVGCSPLIRCMETTFFMTRKWKNPPGQIYVFPLLREIDESSVDKYSKQSRETIRITPSYAIKSIEEQKEYLRKLGILHYFNFSFVEAFPKERLEPGDVKQFIKWFEKFFMPLINNYGQQNLNVFINTHAGVLRDFAQEGFYNNSGFIINTMFKSGFYINKYVSLNPFLKEYDFFTNYNDPKYNKLEYYCPSDRCGQLCLVANGTQTTLKQLSLSCNLKNNNEEEHDDIPLGKLYKKRKITSK